MPTHREILLSIVPPRARWAIAFAVIAGIVAGCARYRRDDVLSAGAADEDGSPSRMEVPVVSVSGPPMDVKPVPVRRVEESAAAPPAVGEEVVARVGSPEPPSAPVRPAGRPELIDAKVGDINGRPVYANEFFDRGPGTRLQQLARERGISREQWLGNAGELIHSELVRITRDELLEAEARAQLKAPQKEGLRAFTQELGEQQRRRTGGSRARLERGLQEMYNLSYEQFLREVEAQALIRDQIERMIRSRVFITRRDMETYYEQNYKTFNPDPRARFRLIRVESGNAAAVESVRAALEGGAAFADVAGSEHNTANPEEGGLQLRTFSGDLSSATLFGSVEELNQAARTLGVGEWTRTPITYGDWTAWLYLESIDEVRRPFDDEQVQMEMLDALSARKEDEIQRKYFARLQERASLNELPAILSRLLRIAEVRYWNPR